MNAAVKPGSLSIWYAEIAEFNAKSQRGFLLPHLRLGAGLVTIFVSSFFAAHLADAFAIIVAYGPHAFFRTGLRISDWKHGILSDGSHLSFVGTLVQIPGTLLFCVAFIFAADFCSMRMSQLMQRKGPWLKVSLSFVGGAALLVFAVSLYRNGAWGAHPVPLSALIGGTVLMWKGFARVFRKSAERTASPRMLS